MAPLTTRASAVGPCWVRIASTASRALEASPARRRDAACCNLYIRLAANTKWHALGGCTHCCLQKALSCSSRNASNPAPDSYGLPTVLPRSRIPSSVITFVEYDGSLRSTVGAGAGAGRAMALAAGSLAAVRKARMPGGTWAESCADIIRLAPNQYIYSPALQAGGSSEHLWQRAQSRRAENACLVPLDASPGARGYTWSWCWASPGVIITESYKSVNGQLLFSVRASARFATMQRWCQRGEGGRCRNSCVRKADQILLRF